MLTRATIAATRRSFKLGYISHALPYKWDSRVNRVRLSNSSIDRICFLLSFAIMSFYEAFLIFRAVQADLSPKKSSNLAGLVNLCYNVCVYAIPVLFHCNVWFRWKEIPHLMNNYFEEFEAFQRHVVRLKDGKRKKNGCEGILRIFNVVAAVLILQNIILILRKPQKQFFLTSLVVTQNDNQIQWYFKFPLVIIHIHIWLNIGGYLLFIASVSYTYVYPMVSILQEMVLKRKSERSGVQSCRKIISQYRRLQILEAMFHYCFEFMLLPGTKVLLSSVAVLGIYGSIRIHGPRSILMAILALGVLVHLSTYFRTSGKLFSTSVAVLESWSGTGGRLMKMSIRSCRPLSFSMGRFYQVQKTTVLVLFGVIINATITILVA